MSEMVAVGCRSLLWPPRAPPVCGIGCTESGNTARQLVDTSRPLGEQKKWFAACETPSPGVTRTVKSLGSIQVYTTVQALVSITTSRTGSVLHWDRLHVLGEGVSQAANQFFIPQGPRSVYKPAFFILPLKVTLVTLGRFGG